MRRTLVVAAIVVFVGAGVAWALVGHHAAATPSLGSINEVGKVVSGITKNLPKDLPKVGKCLRGNDPSRIAKCAGKRLPGIGGIPGLGDGFTNAFSQARHAVRRS